MRIVVDEGRPGYWLKSLMMAAAIETDADEGSPSVDVVSLRGERERLRRTGTVRQAKRAAKRYRAELQKLGEEHFCRKYALPPQFAERQ